MPPKYVPLPLKVLPDTTTRLEALVAPMSASSTMKGVALGRSDVARMALEKGLDVLEAEYLARRPSKR